MKCYSEHLPLSQTLPSSQGTSASPVEAGIKFNKGSQVLSYTVCQVIFLVIKEAPHIPHLSRISKLEASKVAPLCKTSMRLQLKCIIGVPLGIIQ